MHPLVRDLYKRVLIVGRDYPAGLEHVKKKAKEYFQIISNKYPQTEYAIDAAFKLDLIAPSFIALHVAVTLYIPKESKQ